MECTNRVLRRDWFGLPPGSFVSLEFMSPNLACGKIKLAEAGLFGSGYIRKPNRHLRLIWTMCRWTIFILRSMPFAPA